MITNYELRKSIALVYYPFTKMHSFNVMIELLQNIHSEFYLNSKKIIAIITDNITNFPKAFRIFGLNSNSMNKMLDISRK